MDLYFEVLRRKTHIFCDVKENAQVLELKKIIEGILKIPPNQQILKKQNDGGGWIEMEEGKSLAEYGFTQRIARAQAPATIGLMVIGEDEDVMIEPLSVPPPVPDVMRQKSVPISIILKCRLCWSKVSLRFSKLGFVIIPYQSS
ncbi:hypothetical protein AB6A40_011062 [Gnathostoma spinigerum]|uniref:Ubiquitin-like domain-containing protein n=1 Tax=Gnathostoma spinigerum TaxID=75299 RepID=A0ABD6EWL6_9BILA